MRQENKCALCEHRPYTVDRPTIRKDMETMADQTPEERRKEMTEIFADGLELFESRREEKLAKEAAAKKETEGSDNGGNGDTGAKSGGFAEWLLGH